MGEPGKRTVRRRSLLAGSREWIGWAIVKFADLPRVEPILVDLDDRPTQQWGRELFNGKAYRLGPGREAAIVQGSAGGALSRSKKELGRRVEVERDHDQDMGTRDR